MTVASAAQVDILGRRLQFEEDATIGSWFEVATQLDDSATTATLAFGMQSSGEAEAAWFDYLRVEGFGPDRSSLSCSSGSCDPGTFRVYTAGSSEETCEACPSGFADLDEDPMTPCEETINPCQSGENDCASSAVCTYEGVDYLDMAHSCTCGDGLIGDGYSASTGCDCAAGSSFDG